MANKPERAVFAAIAAAVTNYIRLQQEAPDPLVETAAAATPCASTNIGVGTPSPYSLYGRQQIMDMRRLLSLRLVRR